MSGEIVDYVLGGLSGKLYLSDVAFRPNLTTLLLAEAARIEPGHTVLDVGCGVGPLAVYAAMKGAARVYAVDIMEEACACARKNAELNGVSHIVEVRQGSLFEPVEGLKFDVIIDDVSGMAEEVSRISPWYPSTIPTGGLDGTGPTLNLLSTAKRFLAPRGKLYFPVLSLAASKKILDKATEIFGSNLEPIAEKLVPFCEEFKTHLPDLESLRERGLIDFVRKRSRHLWSLKIYCGWASA